MIVPSSRTIKQDFWEIRPCCCSVAWLCLTLCDPMDYSKPGFPVLDHLPELAQTHVHWVSDTIQQYRPLLSTSLWCWWFFFFFFFNIQAIFILQPRLRILSQVKFQMKLGRELKNWFLSQDSDFHRVIFWWVLVPPTEQPSLNLPLFCPSPPHPLPPTPGHFLAVICC